MSFLHRFQGVTILRESETLGEWARVAHSGKVTLAEIERSSGERVVVLRLRMRVLLHWLEKLVELDEATLRQLQEMLKSAKRR